MTSVVDDEDLEAASHAAHLALALAEENRNVAELCAVSRALSAVAAVRLRATDERPQVQVNVAQVHPAVERLLAMTPEEREHELRRAGVLPQKGEVEA